MIKLILSIFHSRRDGSGNVYWAFHATDPQTGKTVCGKIAGGESNITAAAFEIAEGATHTTVTEEPIRQFNRHIKDFKYAGCPSGEIAIFIKRGLGWEISVEDWTVVGKEISRRSHPEQPIYEYYLSNGVKYIRGENRNALKRGQVLTVENNYFEKHGFSWTRNVQGTPFKIASISENTNSFGLHGHVLIAPNGEAWEVARARYEGTHWNRGVVVTLSADRASALIHLSCEIPKRLPDAPEGVIAEAWEN